MTVQNSNNASNVTTVNVAGGTLTFGGGLNFPGTANYGVVNGFGILSGPNISGNGTLVANSGTMTVIGSIGANISLVTANTPNSAFNFPGQVEMSKLLGYAAMTQVDARMSKLLGYAAMSQVDARVSKLVAYVVLTPGPSPTQRFMGSIL